MNRREFLRTACVATSVAVAIAASAAPGPERDYFNDAEFRREYRDGAVEIARRKMASDEQKRVKSGVETPFKVRERISTGGGFS